jgi:hypothetical protein
MKKERKALLNLSILLGANQLAAFLAITNITRKKNNSKKLKPAGMSALSPFGR